MDESRASRSGEIRIQEKSSDDILGLLCSWDGDIRDHLRKGAIPRAHGHRHFREGDARRTSHSRTNVSGASMGYDGTVLGI